MTKVKISKPMKKALPKSPPGGFRGYRPIRLAMDSLSVGEYIEIDNALIKKVRSIVSYRHKTRPERFATRSLSDEKIGVWRVK